MLLQTLLPLPLKYHPLRLPQHQRPRPAEETAVAWQAEGAAVAEQHPLLPPQK